MALIRDASQQYSVSGTTITITTPAGAQAGDILVAFIYTDAASGNIVDSSGDFAELREGTDGGGTPAMRGALYVLELPGAPDADYTFTHADSLNNIVAGMVCVNPNGDTYVGATSTLLGTTGSATGASGALTGLPDPSVLLIGWGADDSGTISSPPADMTQQEFVDGAGMDCAIYSQLNPGEGSLTKSLTWSFTTEHVVLAALLEFASSSGPTIDEQPVDATARLHGDPTATATFTMEYTLSGAHVATTVQVDDGGGFEVLDIEGIYALSDNETHALTFTITPTDLSLDGYDYRITIEDENGSTVSDTFTLTVLNGPIVDPTSDTTDGSGQSVADTSTDDPTTANGEVLLTTCTDVLTGAVRRMTGNAT